MQRIIFYSLLIPLLISSANKQHQSSPELKELKSLTSEYTIDMARENGDVIIDSFGKPYNFDDFYNFLDNVDSNIPDKIRFTRYTLRGIPLIGILKYDCQNIKFIYDTTRSQAVGAGDIKFYTGDDIVLIVNEGPLGDKIGEYDLLTPKDPSRDDVTIFSFNYSALE